MHPIFSVTIFTGQQLVLEAIQRWLQRPCVDVDSQRARRLGLKGLISLLLRTAATGVLATVLDAAIEFRRRQLLAAAAAEPGEDAAAAGSRFPGLGMLSRTGVAAWKSRLLLCVDELERKAEAYGIESRHRYIKDAFPSDAAASVGASKPTAAALARQPGSSADLVSDEERSQRLGRTVDQLRELVKQGDAESERSLDDEVGSLVDLLLGTLPTPPASPATFHASAASRSPSIAAALDSLGAATYGNGSCGGMNTSRSCAALAAPAAEVAEPSSPCGSSGSGEGCEVCQICMDRGIKVQVAGCSHGLCFGCARRLCAGHDHLAPQCPFCRQAIDGFVGIPASRHAGASSAGASSMPVLA